MSKEILMLADALAHETGFTNQTPAVPYEIPNDLAEAAGIAVEQLAAVREVMCSELEKAQEAFQIKAA